MNDDSKLAAEALGSDCMYGDNCEHVEPRIGSCEKHDLKDALTDGSKVIVTKPLLDAYEAVAKAGRKVSKGMHPIIDYLELDDALAQLEAVRKATA